MNAINQIKQELKKNIGEKIAIKEKTFRGKSKIYIGEIDSVHNNFFSIKTGNDPLARTTNYASILTGEAHIIIGYKKILKNNISEKITRFC